MISNYPQNEIKMPFLEKDSSADFTTPSEGMMKKMSTMYEKDYGTYFFFDRSFLCDNKY
jgi:hypothetical protein